MKDLTALKNLDPSNTLDSIAAGPLYPLYIRFSSPLEHRFNQLLKRGIDLFISSLLLLFFFSWLFPLLALFIRLDSAGPVFFLQKRNRKDGKSFTCIKFRTMVVNREADILPATENDCRITRVGRFLRIHHLDELPQLLNVWWGHMSMIGPRPYMISDNKKYEKIVRHYHTRHKVKPGITGLAQIHGDAGRISKIEDMQERVKKDIYYIHNWSPALDTKIFFRTIFRILKLKL